MRHAFMGSVRVLCLAALVFCLAGTVLAGGRRDFAASYQLANITDDGNVVHLTITLNFRNNSGAIVHNGSVALLSLEANPSLLGSFPLMKTVNISQMVTTSQTFSVSKAEYQLWEQGRDPGFYFVLEDSNGSLRTQEIDLHRITLGVNATK